MLVPKDTSVFISDAPCIASFHAGTKNLLPGIMRTNSDRKQNITFNKFIEIGKISDTGLNIKPIERTNTGSVHIRLIKKSLRISFSLSRSLSSTLSGSFLIISSYPVS